VPASSVISARDLWKVYLAGRERVEAVRDVSLDLAPGEFLAIVGRSGSGKSTLLALLGGLTRPTQGSVHVDGIDLWSLDDAARSRLRNQTLGFVFQFAALIPTLRAIDNVALPALFRGPGVGAARYEAAAELLRRVGLAERLEAYPGELSGGESRRVALARALINHPRILLADEPTADLDGQTEQEVMALLLRVNREQGTSVLLVTHDGALAAQAGRVLRMKQGDLVA
jgi:ABC-type lipoprotein export system ATPase subunit